MKKILFICDGENFSKGSMDFIRWMNQDGPVFVKGVFLSPIDFNELIAISYIPIAKPYISLMEKEEKQRIKSEESFKSECRQHNIRYEICERGDWDKELMIKESRFADVMLISGELFCSQIFDTQPNFYLQETIRGAECPVVVVPENFKTPERVVVAYDGQKECLRALKQFCYLLPGFTDLPTEFTYINNDADTEIPDQDLLKEYVKCHFNSSNIEKLCFDSRKYFSTWAEEKKNIMLVSGSYSRSPFSDSLKPSFAEAANTRTLNFPYIYSKLIKPTSVSMV